MADQQIPGVVFQPRSYQGMQRGINQMVDAVRPTLGPRPHLVAVENTFRGKTPELLDNAGVISRRIIQLPDRDADMGAMLVRHLLWRLHEEVGDGTATAAVIFQTVYNRGVRYIAAGGNPILLRRHLEHGLREILQQLDGLTMAVEGKERLTQLAESLCSDPSLATMLGEIFDIVGSDGQVDVRTGNRRELERHYVEGMYWKSSVFSPRMFADQVKLRTDLADACVLIGDLELEDPRALFPLLEQAMSSGVRSMVVLASKLSDTVLALLLAANREPEKFRVVAVKTPGLGTVEQAAAMEDLAILTGGRAVIKAAGDTLRGVKLEDLGRSRRAWCDRTNVGIIGGKGDPRRLRRHIADLRAASAVAKDQQQRTRLQQRVGKLIGGSATLLVGGSTEPEITAREELARRTSEQLRLALREGVLPGGGSALLACRSRLRQLLEASVDTDQQAAYRILLEALEEPFRTIAGNAGYDASTLLSRIDCAGTGRGFDMRSGELVDMAAAGICDLAGALKAALRGAVSAAATALTVDILVHKRKPESAIAKP